MATVTVANDVTAGSVVVLSCVMLEVSVEVVVNDVVIV